MRCMFQVMGFTKGDDGEKMSKAYIHKISKTLGRYHLKGSLAFSN